MTTSPFKFLDAYDKKDKDIFFGRETEIEQLYKMVFQTNLILVYGQSGTGKTSIVQCGLANRFLSTDWYDLYIRRVSNINNSFRKVLHRHALTPLDEEMTLTEMVESIYLDYLKPIYLIFDQFEELFILGTKSEQEKFVHDLAALLETNIPCKVLIVMREEYIAWLYDFEKVIPHLFNKRVRIEPMNRENVKKVIKGSTEAFDIEIEDEEETIPQIIDNVSDGRSGIQLSYLQVYLDKLYREATKD